MQFKATTVLLLAATLANCAPVGATTDSLSRRDLEGSIKSAANKIRKLQGSVQSTIGKVTNGWNGAVGAAAQNAARKAESGLLEAAAALDELDQAVTGGCHTYNNCENIAVHL